MVNFWRDKGVKGFRFDVINLIGKDEVLVDCPENEGKPAYTDKPIVHDYLRYLMTEAAPLVLTLSRFIDSWRDVSRLSGLTFNSVWRSSKLYWYRWSSSYSLY